MDIQDMLTAPAPWALTGSGYVMVLSLPHDFARNTCFMPEHLRDAFTGGPATMMYVDYSYSDAGPYRELLFIPGRFNIMKKRFYSITKIFVSTMESVTNGRRNWGIPKELAEFACERKDPATEHIRIIKDRANVASFTFRSSCVRVPVTTGLVPRSLRTLAHIHEAGTYLTTPMARGWVSPARLVDSVIDGTLFPDITGREIIATFRVPRFFMVFPTAEIFPRGPASSVNGL